LPVRLFVALSVAAVLAVFLLYTSFAGGASDSLRPSQLLAGQYESTEVQLAGIVVGPIEGDAHDGGLRFELKDFDGETRVPVVYAGSVPDLFGEEKHVYLQGTLRGDTFIGIEDSLVTKCPSKYAPKQDPAVS
jgi:cytochrome c-type biogenesis protein CcmE